ncbi:DNA ligase [Johnsonella ignava ATCC 51276]|uniref:DNA ligase n=2 Tax=Johnsonella TaxID=43994 RepID=G5GFA7_9FIRM|nr:NAD-dependent DNA ligase LigA [Johnsonella ignava]EHI56568.1 DNA ligase [Johnsonella ignava ATCC 51276]
MDNYDDGNADYTSINTAMPETAPFKRMRELIALLNKASEAYYKKNIEIMDNYEYDRLYDELLMLEKKSGIVLSASPTQKVGYEVLESLPKKEHDTPMLSLNKTKSVEDLKGWLGSEKALLSWKLDGLTIVLNYDGGILKNAVTRGNGIVGEVITDNARNFKNIPVKIDFNKELILRGEAVISYSDFDRINEQIPDLDAKYKNPRNLCSGSVRQLNPEITASRSVYFYAFTLVSAQGVDFKNSIDVQMQWLKDRGFDTVEYIMTEAKSIETDIKNFENRIEKNNLPSDGLVLIYDDIEYGKSLGSTSKFPRNSIAFKWSDELKETKLLDIEWSPSRTGLINPIAIFEPVELEGTTVSRASVHNLSMVEGLKLGKGDIISVYKANMIIPQIAKNLTGSGSIKPPDLCPACGHKPKIKQEADVKTVHCTNKECPIRHIKGFALLAGRDALNIDGLSEKTLEKFISLGFIKEASDIFKLSRHKDEIVAMEGFGEKSYENLEAAIQKASHTTLPRLLYSLGITGIGLSNAKILSSHFDFDLERIKNAKKEELTEIDGIGSVLASAIEEYFSNSENILRLDRLLSCIEIEKVQKSGTYNENIAGKTFVITGKTQKFENRKKLQEIIENSGGKVSSSVSASTAYLINNDISSTSSKNKKAVELGVSIITEEEFLNLLNTRR